MLVCVWVGGETKDMRGLVLLVTNMLEVTLITPYVLWNDAPCFFSPSIAHLSLSVGKVEGQPAEEARGKIIGAIHII